MTQANNEDYKAMTKDSHRSIRTRRSDQDGSAMVIALLIMILLMAFVALAVSRTNNETIAASNDEQETLAYEAANASLEVLTRNFNKNFEVKLTIDPTDIARIKGQVPPGFTDYDFSGQNITQTAATKDVVMTGEMFQGLNARRDEWQLDTVARDLQDSVQVALRRKFLNNRIPIFQFGIFYDDDLEFHPGPRFDFGGRVHSNGSLFMLANTGLYFSSKVSAHNEVFTDVGKNGFPWTNWNENVFIKNASGTYVQLTHSMGSVLTSPVNGPPVTNNPEPTAYANANWTANQNQFQGNLLAHTPPLQLPMKLNSDIGGLNLDLVEVVKRGKSVGDVWNDGTGTVASPNLSAVTTATSDDKVTAADRYYNKTGIRITLADAKVKLPGCSTSTATPVTGVCGKRLDGDSGGDTAGTISGTRGYLPIAMQGTPAYQATRINGKRFDSDLRELWIKIETVQYNALTTNYDTQDITADILSLGVTDPPPNDTNFKIADTNYNTNGIDGRSIINLQRFVMNGPALPASTYISNIGTYNYVEPGSVATGKSCTNTSDALTAVDNGVVTGSPNFFPNSFGGDERALMRSATISGISGVIPCVVPFPIEMFDTREGLYNDSTSVFDPLSTTAPGYGTKVPWAGVMSMIDIDVANLKKFLDGNFDANMPSGTQYSSTAGHVLRGSDIPQKNGWVMYISDRRGDYDFDGEYDMEDVYGNNDGILQTGEDINKNGTLQADYANEAVRYTGGSGATATSISPDIAATLEHKFYRRAVRLVNGSRPPGLYDTTTPANTKGFSFASEQGVYVQGNYNATGIANVGTPTLSTDYLPQGSNDIPCSVVGDALTSLSNSWTDGESFLYPFAYGSRGASETTQRYAILSGDALTTLNATPNQGGNDTRMAGGVHNFIRFLEDWGGSRLNYSGSLINLFNSHNNNGTYKNGGTHVYSPPDRNWIFDASFLDINRMPPGTPYFQNIQVTGFQRINN